MPNGGIRIVEKSCEAYNRKVSDKIEDIFHNYRKTHNDGVFDAYTPEIRAARSSHLITGLPDGYGRGRIIGDYRRVALYGVDALIEAKKSINFNKNWIKCFTFINFVLEWYYVILHKRSAKNEFKRKSRWGYFKG